MIGDRIIDPSVVCMPCWLAARPPMTVDQHGCPQFVIVVYGGVPSIKPCACLVCWPDGPPPVPETPRRLAFPEG